MLKKIRQGEEGLVIILIGLFLLVNALRIPTNPIKYEGWTNILAQAKFMPTLMACGITILGAVLFVKQMKGADRSNQLTRAEWIRMGTVLLLMVLYIFGVYKFKFMIPTILFAFVILFFLNWKQKKLWQLAALSLLAIVLGLLVMPYLINLKLPMM
ncbi:tripartite tricarboxylate transporter TctB family protein [Oscillospiraceae bacterium 50-60]